MAEKLPYIQLFPGDWLKDDVAGCSLAAQGLWLRMMFLAHCSDRCGYLGRDGVPIPSEIIAQRCGTTLLQYTTLLTELDNAGVPSRTSEGIIFSRRMVRDAKIRKAARINGLKGGNPSLVNKTSGVNRQVNLGLNMNMKMKSSGKGGSGERVDAARTVSTSGSEKNGQSAAERMAEKVMREAKHDRG